MNVAWQLPGILVLNMNQVPVRSWRGVAWNCVAEHGMIIDAYM